jgi:hypothetical protein
MQIEDILDDLPTTPEGRADLIAQLLEMIDHWNAGINRHQSYPDPDLGTIAEFMEVRNTYVGHLALLLNQHGLVLQLPTPPQPDRRLAE